MTKVIRDLYYKSMRTGMLFFLLCSVSPLPRMLFEIYSGTQGGILSKRDGMGNYRAIGMRKTYLNVTRTVASLNQDV